MDTTKTQNVLSLDKLIFLTQLMRSAQYYVNFM